MMQSCCTLQHCLALYRTMIWCLYLSPLHSLEIVCRMLFTLSPALPPKENRSERRVESFLSGFYCLPYGLYLRIEARNVDFLLPFIIFRIPMLLREFAFYPFRKDGV